MQLTTIIPSKDYEKIKKELKEIGVYVNYTFNDELRTGVEVYLPIVGDKKIDEEIIKIMRNYELRY